MRHLIQQDSYGGKQGAYQAPNGLANGLEKVLTQYKFHDLVTMLGTFFLAYRFGRVSDGSPASAFDAP